MRSFEIESRYDIEKVGQDDTNGYDTFGMLNREGNFTINLLKDTEVDYMLTAHAQGTIITFTINFGGYDALADLNIVVTGKCEEVAYDADGLFSADVDGFCDQDDFLIFPLHNVYGLCYKSICGKL